MSLCPLPSSRQCPVGLQSRGLNRHLPASTSGVAGTHVHTMWIKHSDQMTCGKKAYCGPQLHQGRMAQWRENLNPHSGAEGSELTHKRWRSVHRLYFTRPDSPCQGTVLPIVTTGLPTSTDAIKSFSEAAHNLDTLSPLSQAHPEAPLLGASRGCRTDS